MSTKKFDTVPPSTSSTKRWIQVASPALKNQIFIKRSLAPHEQSLYSSPTSFRGQRIKQGIRNEAAAIEFVRTHTAIPVPNVVGCFEDRGQQYLLLEKVQGVVELRSIPVDKRAPINAEVESFVQQLHALKSDRFGGVTGEVCPPARLTYNDPEAMDLLVHTYRPEQQVRQDFAFCHGDLNTTNILVDPVTLHVKCIIDWEFAGFYPPEFEGYWWKRDGYANVLPGEEGLEDTSALKEKVMSLATPESKAAALQLLEQGPEEREKAWAESLSKRTLGVDDPALFPWACISVPVTHPLYEVAITERLLRHALMCLISMTRGNPLPPVLDARVNANLEKESSTLETLKEEHQAEDKRLKAVHQQFRESVVQATIQLVLVDPIAWTLLWKSLNKYTPQRQGKDKGTTGSKDKEKGKDKDKDGKRPSKKTSAPETSIVTETSATTITNTDPMSNPQSQSQPGTSPSSVPDTSPIQPSPLNPQPIPASTSNAQSNLTATRPPPAELHARPSATSPPIDPSKLNQTPAPIPIPDSGADADGNFNDNADSSAGAGAPLTSPPLRDPNADSTSSSAYLDSNPSAPIEPSSHPTVAETGSLSKSPVPTGPGPKTGQLERKEKKKTGEGIIKLGSFGGEGLVAKPPPGLKAGDDEAIE